MRIAIAMLMLFHGVAHLPGFAVPWRLVSSPEMPYRTTVLAGHLYVGATGIRAVGVLWLLLALAFVAAAASAFASREWWVPLATGVAFASLALSLVALPGSRIGVAVNLVLLAALFAANRFVWN
jgi:hypothetical protein